MKAATSNPLSEHYPIIDVQDDYTFQGGVTHMAQGGRETNQGKESMSVGVREGIKGLLQGQEVWRAQVWRQWLLLFLRQVLDSVHT
jgi:hypothetical protein